MTQPNPANTRRAFGQQKPASREGMAWLTQVLSARDKQVVWYATKDDNPTRQLKNKLSQAASYRGGVLFLTLATDTALDRTREALVERWGGNPEWPKALSCVALSLGGEVKTVVVWQDSEYPRRIQEFIAPDVEIITAKRPASGEVAPAAQSTSALAEELCVDESQVAEWLELLTAQRAVIFYGPPGTGKTFIARRLAHHLQPRPELRRFVQLHPSYGYEEFFEGYRPAESADPQSQGSGLRLEKRDGPLRELVRRAEDEPEENAVLIMDEVNRGNLPRVFGELYFLIEYRDQEISLMYSPDESFSLPPKLTFIATMNSADRSVAVVDQALRRRFHFVPLFPGEPPVDQMLRRFLQKRCPDMAYVAEILDAANRRLPRHMRIGPSHFMRADLDERVLARVWKYAVLPSIAEHYFDREEELERELSLSTLVADLAKPTQSQ